MSRILDQYGQPIDPGALKDVLREPQTARIAALANRWLEPMLTGLSPAGLAAVLRAADDGDLYAQHRVFSDMEERDAHLAAEMAKRHLAVMGLDWDIAPPRNATAAEKAAASWVKEVLSDGVDPIEDLILALMKGVGHGFAAVELEWRRSGAEWLPVFWPRPQEWFRLDPARRELRLQDQSADGAALQPFGWMLHTHGKAKTGYLGRMGLYRALVWPFLYKSYSLGDFAEFLEVHGLPIVLGKYHGGASDEEKASLMRAVTALGHDARAIMPADMQLEVMKITADGSGTPHLSMMRYCDEAISKVVLGQVLSSDAKPTGLGSGVADLHAEVRHDIRDADAGQIAGTITRDLVWPLLALNRGLPDPERRPRFVFDTGEAADLALFADALPKLAAAGVRIDPAWVAEKLRMPVVDSGSPPPPPPAALAALKGAAAPPGDAVDRIADPLARSADPRIDRWLATIRAMLDSAQSLEEFEARLLAAYPVLPADELARAMAGAMSVAELAGMSDVADGD